MKSPPYAARRTVTLATFLACACAAAADQAPDRSSGNGFEKPKWLTDLSVNAKESYDDNVMMVYGKTTANNSAALGTESSWITTVSPKIGVNFAPLLGKSSSFQSLGLAYTPDYALYHNASAETYYAQKFNANLKGKTGDFSFLVNNDFWFIDGNTAAPTYGLGATSADQAYGDRNASCYAVAIERERRKQIQDRPTITLQYDVGQVFIRPTACMQYYDLMTDWHNNAVNTAYNGYQNFSDRYDLNGGADIGYKFIPNLAVTLGYRYGHQFQQSFPSSVNASTVNGIAMHSSSDYQRILLGLEGKPWSWLNVKLLGGPDFRVYNSGAPMDDDNFTTYYGEASLIATLTPNHTLAFSYKQWQWVSSIGRLPYFDSLYALTYHWTATKKLGVDISAKLLESDYTSASTVKTSNSCLRDDGLYMLSAGVTYNFTKQLSASASYAYNLGRNFQDLTGSLALSEAYREFDQQIVSAGLQYKF